MRETGVCKGRFENSGLCGRQEYAKAGLRKQVYARDRSVQGPV
jgi:hypothetical protein